MTRLDADIAIVGAGLAGLSLAAHLLERGPRGVTLALFEPRTRWTRDRTWCRWQTDAPNDLFADCIAHRWTRWRVRDSQRSVVRGSARYPYVEVPADRLYDRVLTRLDATPHAALLAGTRVTALRERPGAVELELEDGGIFRAGLAFDARPLAPPGLPPLAPGDVALLQHFQGRFVRAERAVFDPSCVELMDFTVDQRHGIAFVYVLPYGPHEALVEATWFSPALHPQQIYDAVLDDWLARHVPGGHTVLDTERGVLPMTSARFAATHGQRTRGIGLRGGLARSSTGYAFAAIQRDARALAEALRRAPGVLPQVNVRSRTTELLDAVFLGWLARNPARAPALFVDLFERVAPERLVRFLSEAAQPLDLLAVTRACPTLPFAAEAVRRLRQGSA